MSEQKRYEIIVIGGGIAGASFAYQLGERGVGDVLLLEKEEAPGYHATGRSAAVSYRFDTDWTMQHLRIESTRFFDLPPEGFCENRLLTASGIMLLFSEETWPAIPELARLFASQEVRIELLSPEGAAERVEVLNPAAYAGAAFMPDDGHLDVHQLLTSYLRGAKKRGARVRCGCEVTSLLVENGRCVGVATPEGKIRSRWVINAAGAWAGGIAALAGAAPIAMTPLRRCAATFASPPGLEAAGWPMVGSQDLKIYFKPDAGRLLTSPMDEVPSEPCDARPDDLAIAEAMERLRGLAPRIVPHALQSKWAGLRTFSPDRLPVVGPDPLLPGFFWHAGQGGSGIETSPELARVGVELLLDGKCEGLDAERLSPARFA